ncbi:hypothetical protein L210DRAFT_3525134, partial [Boletus edulis BED1]
GRAVNVSREKRSARWSRYLYAGRGHRGMHLCHIFVFPSTRKHGSDDREDTASRWH